MRIISLSVFLLLCMFVTRAQEMSLQQCIDTALKRNILVQQTGLQMHAAEVNKNQAKMNLLPNVNGNWNYGNNFGRNVDPITNTYTNNQLSSSNAGLDAGVILFNGMRLQNLIQQTNFSYKAAELDYKQAQDNLLLNVTLAYMQVLLSEDILTVSRTQLQVTKKQIERMEVLVKEGSAGSYQLTDIKGQQANELIAIVNLENSLQQAKLTLCQLMNVPYAAGLQLQRGIQLNNTLYTQTAADVIAAAMEYMALVKANQYRIKSAEKNIQVAKSGYYPTISLGASAGSSYSSLFTRLTPTTVSEIETGTYIKNGAARTPVYREMQNFSSSSVRYFKQMENNIGFFTGISMQIPLFNNLQTKNRVRLAKLTLKNTELEADNTVYQLKQNIEQAWVNMEAAYKRLTALNEQQLNYEESFRAAEVRFENGVINAAEFLIAKNNLDRTKISLVQAKYEYSFRTRLLDFYQGKTM
ncbi:outer membrane protein [Lacibacter cauensis]|uniref:Outer membrane protein n=1 Tax=Lacibacter cauensis TaxID=510947 RepID=A0A562SDI3_9BACT|nr:TolC family protein [Lacibacter cauensis]TWI79347.1 outer membrane protein [Lacibacter cauensis]